MLDFLKEAAKKGKELYFVDEGVPTGFYAIPTLKCRVKTGREAYDMADHCEREGGEIVYESRESYAEVASERAQSDLRARLGSKIGVEPLKGYGASDE